MDSALASAGGPATTDSSVSVSHKLALEAQLLEHGVIDGAGHDLFDLFVKHPLSTAFELAVSGLAGVTIAGAAERFPNATKKVAFGMRAMFGVDLAT